MRGLTGFAAAGTAPCASGVEAQHVIVRAKTPGAYMKSFDGTRWTDWVPLGGTSSRPNSTRAPTRSQRAHRRTGDRPGAVRTLRASREDAGPVALAAGAQALHAPASRMQRRRGAHVFVHGNRPQNLPPGRGGRRTRRFVDLARTELRGAPDATSSAEGRLTSSIAVRTTADWYVAFCRRAGGRRPVTV